MDPDDIDIKASLGKSLLSCGTYGEAIECVEVVLKKVSWRSLDFYK